MRAFAQLRRQLRRAERGKPLDENAIASAERTLLTEIAPIDDLRSTARYRTRVAQNLLREFLVRL